ncbi:MAG: hypothetical protein K6F94_01275 [Bacteroidaceae bacterium]|nr:hypothetical protein [Bacteroidaceae bacterium]
MKTKFTRFAALIIMAAIPYSIQAINIDDLTLEQLADSIESGTGIAPKLTLNSAVQGSTVIFARLTRSGQAASKGLGICYSSTNPEPTVLDSRSNMSYSNNGEIYELSDLKPATVYYIRAYGVGVNWKVGYSKVIKLYTRPAGNVGYDYDYAGDEATNQRITDACEEAVWMWNNVSGIQGFHLSAHYVPGAGADGGTADCSYGGNMRISQNQPYQRTGTVLHEGSHGLGVINYTDWVNSIYRTNGDRGDWLGPRVDRVIQFLENDASAKLHGDDIHMWPYGINGAHEDTGAPMLYRANALLVGALAEDAIRTPNQNFIRPAYSFEQVDTAKYYIKNESMTDVEENDKPTSYLRLNNRNQFRWVDATSVEVLENDSFAWYITYNPQTCYYTFKNVGTGRTLSYNGSSFQAAANTNASTSRIQLLAARTATKIGTFTFANNSYWLVDPSGSKALGAVSKNMISALDFDHSDAAQAQRWFLMTEDEVVKFGKRVADKVLAINPVLMTENPESPLLVAGSQGAAIITNQGEGCELAVISLNGHLMKSLYIASGATASVSLPRGIYIIGGHKVAVK